MNISESIRLKVSIVIALTDGFTGNGRLTGVVGARLENGVRAVKKDGCLIFCNCSEGFYRIVIESDNYIKQEVEIALKNEIKIVDAVLMPSEKYPFFGDHVKLRGRTEGSAEIAFIFEKEYARLIGAYRKGDRRISAFFDESLRFASRRICVKSGADASVYTFNYLGGTDYETDRQLEFDISGESRVGFVYEISPDENGEYFLAVKGCYKEACVFYKGKIVELEISSSEMKLDLSL